MRDETAMSTSPVPAQRRDWVAAAAVLTLLLIVAFAPVVSGQQHLMLAGWDAPSIMDSGAYDPAPRPNRIRVARTADPGAPAWQTEPWFKLISQQYWGEFNLPLWNPYNAFGTPLAASAQPQPFFPPTALLSLHVTTWTYSLFILARLLLAGLLTYLFARQHLSFLPSLFAAITFMLSGYFIANLNMPHISVELLTPGLLLALEILARRNSWTAAAGVATAIFLISTAGMPESMFLAVSFGCLYFVCRVLFAAELRARARSLLVRFFVAILLGFALSAFILLPFIEFVRVAFDLHRPSSMGGLRVGLGHDGDFASTIQYLLPLIFGPPLGSVFQNLAGFSGLRGYWGVVPFFFAVAAVLSACSRRRSATKDEQFLIAFFAIMLSLMVLKRFGSPVINWIGFLPVAEMVIYPKYQEPLIALCVAMLAGIGFSILIERRATLRLFLPAGVVVVAAMLATGGAYLSLVLSPDFKWAKLFYFLSMALGAGLVITLVLGVALIRRSKSMWHLRLARAFVGLLSVELLINFILPCFYLIGSFPPAKADPYAGAPYIGFIRGVNADYSRVFAREGFLYPNWSSAFGLADVRDIDALSFERYRRFTRHFLHPSGGDARVQGDLVDRFTGTEFPYELDTQAERRFLALSSVRYLVTNSEFGWPSRWLNEIVEQHRGEIIPGFGLHTFRFGRSAVRSIRGLLQYPPSSGVSYRVFIASANPVFEAVAVLNESAATRDGMGFKLEIKDGEAVQTLFETHIDPRNVPADREGRQVRINLSRYAGREIELLLSTDARLTGNGFGDYGGWAGLRFVAENETPVTSEFRKIYDGEVRVYEAPNALPRAALFHAIEVVPDDAVLARLKAPDFNPHERAVVSRESIPPGVDLSALTAGPGAAASAARITGYHSQHVAIEAETPAPALLVLNDTNYPGWRAYLNGQPADMLTANFLFRGVLLPPGKSTVEFKYQPWSFRIGGGVSFAALALLALLVMRDRRQARRAASSFA